MSKNPQTQGVSRPGSIWQWALPGVIALGVALAVVALQRAYGTRDFHHEAEELAHVLPLWAGIPFAGILLSIALMPLLAAHIWHHHYKKIAVAWAIVLAIPFLVAHRELALYKILEVLLIDYVPFIILLWGLYTVSGGILLRGTLVGRPALNTGVLIIGTVLASFMGTTGAAMLLVRPLLRANSGRKYQAHVMVFFIFLVANIGGILTPLGDPPLFLGFLHGVPFFWTMHLLPELVVVATTVLVVFFIIDTFLYRREQQASQVAKEAVAATPLKLEGLHNFLFIAMILGAVLLSGKWQPGGFAWFGIHFEYNNLVRDLLIIIAGTLSLVTTSRQLRQDNGFTWSAIAEVAFLFFGIFVTIVPVLMILRAGTEGAMAFLIRHVSEPWHYFWMAGGLSSFLDNAPTYLTFFNLALGQVGLPEDAVPAALTGALATPEAIQLGLFLTAISLGAVFMGANTYIGNAPNFMVLSLAKEHGVNMPSFFGYMVWSICVLIPCFILVTFIFF